MAVHSSCLVVVVCRVSKNVHTGRQLSGKLVCSRCTSSASFIAYSCVSMGDNEMKNEKMKKWKMKKWKMNGMQNRVSLASLLRLVLCAFCCCRFICATVYVKCPVLSHVMSLKRLRHLSILLHVSKMRWCMCGGRCPSVAATLDWGFYQDSTGMWSVGWQIREMAAFVVMS